MSKHYQIGKDLERELIAQDGLLLENRFVVLQKEQPPDFSK